MYAGVVKQGRARVLGESNKRKDITIFIPLQEGIKEKDSRQA